MEEKFIFTIIVSKDSLDFSLPLNGFSTTGIRGGVSYDWIIDWGDNNLELKVGTSFKLPKVNLGWISHTYSEEGVYQITIRPNKDHFGWMRAWGCYTYPDIDDIYQSNALYTKYEIAYKIVSFDYVTNKSFMASKTSYGDYYMANIYCSSITTCVNEIKTVSEDNIVHIGNNFKSSQYSNCIHLLKAQEEILPVNIKHIGSGFLDGQYASCISLQNSAKEFLPSSVIVIEDFFRCNQYAGCHNLHLAAAEYLPDTIITIKEAFRKYQYAGCISLLSPPDECLSDVISIRDFFRAYQYATCINLKEIAKERMSNSIMYIGAGFRHKQYSNTRLNLLNTNYYAYTSPFRKLDKVDKIPYDMLNLTSDSFLV